MVIQIRTYISMPLLKIIYRAKTSSLLKICEPFIIVASKKKVLGILKIALCLRDRHVFMWQLMKNLNLRKFWKFVLTLKRIFWRVKTLVTKPEYRFLDESTFQYKTALSEPIVKRNRIGVQYEPITKNVVFPITALFFLKFYFSLRTS